MRMQTKWRVADPASSESVECKQRVRALILRFLLGADQRETIASRPGASTAKRFHRAECDSDDGARKAKTVSDFCCETNNGPSGGGMVAAESPVPKRRRSK